MKLDFEVQFHSQLMMRLHLYRYRIGRQKRTITARCRNQECRWGQPSKRDGHGRGSIGLRRTHRTEMIVPRTHAVKIVAHDMQNSSSLARTPLVPRTNSLGDRILSSGAGRISITYTVWAASEIRPTRMPPVSTPGHRPTSVTIFSCARLETRTRQEGFSVQRNNHRRPNIMRRPQN